MKAKPEEDLTQIFVNKHRSLGQVQEVLTPEEAFKVQTAKETNIILMVGAGMGFESKLPMGWTAKERIEEALVLQKRMQKIGEANFLKEMKEGSQALIPEANYQANLELLTQATGRVGQEPDFEMHMSALSQTPAMENAVRKELTKMFKIRHHTTLGHKAIAHLFKYRIIRTIINYNFDEQLDKALADTMRDQDSKTIISDGDIAEKSSDRGAESLHIKTHGTESHPASMRFRKHDYTLTPPAILDSINEKFEGKVALVLAGFAMESVEINELIHKKIKKVLERAVKKYNPEIDDYDAEKRLKAMETRVEKNGVNTEDKRKVFLNDFPELSDLEFEKTDLDLNIYTMDVVKKETTNIPSFNVLNAISPRLHHLYSQESLGGKINPGEDILPMIMDDMVKIVSEKKLAEFRPLNISKLTSSLFQNLVYDTKFKRREKAYKEKYEKEFKESLKQGKDKKDREKRRKNFEEEAQAYAEEKSDNLDDNNFLISVHYLQTLVEILFAIAREKGFIDLEAVGKEKVGRHYQFYLESCQLLNQQGRQKEIVPESLYEICMNLGLKNTTYAVNNLSIPEEVKTPEILAEEKKLDKRALKIKKEKEMKRWIFEYLEKAIDRLKEKYESENREDACDVLDVFKERLFESEKNKDLMETALRTLFEGINKDIYHPAGDIHHSFFPEEIKGEVEKVHTWEDTDRITCEALSKDNWNEFWMLSQSGAWFFRDEHWNILKERVLNSDEIITVRIVATKFTPLEDNAEFEYEEALKKELKSHNLTASEKKKLKENLKVVYEQIPYWEHHHMLSGTVLRDKDGKCDIKTALHGSRVGNRDFISPILFSKENETKGLDVRENTLNYLKYLEYLFKLHFLQSKRRKFDEKNKGTKQRPNENYFLDPCGCEDRVQMRIDAEWEWAIEQI